MKGKIVQQKNNLRITKYGKTYYVYNPSGVLLGTFLNKKDAFDFCSSNESFTIKRGINDNDIIDKFKPIIRASFKSNYDCADAPNCLTVTVFNSYPASLQALMTVPCPLLYALNDTHTLL